MTATLIHVNTGPAMMAPHAYAKQDIQEKVATQVRKLANLNLFSIS